MYPSLAIDCSDKISSIAIYDGDKLWQVTGDTKQKQARKILSLIDECLEKANINKSQLKSICWAAGPGSFTGLRIATAVSQGLAYALKLPLFGVSSLEALAISVVRTQLEQKNELEGPILVITDAYMGEYYWAAFSASSKIQKVERLSPDSLSALEDIQLPKDLVMIAGNSADKVEIDQQVLTINESPMRAQDLFSAAETQYDNAEQVSAMHAEPAYLRSKSAWKTLNQQKQKA